MTNTNASLTRTVLDASDMKCRCALVVTEGGERTGCTGTTARTFKPGHDAKLKSLLGQAHANGEAVIVTIPGDTQDTEVTMSPLEAAGRFGNFGYMVVEIAAKIQAKRERAAAHKAKLAANRAKREAEKANKKPRVAKVVIPVQAKVGRWTYEGVVKAGRFVYTNGKGETVASEKFTLIEA